MKKINKTVLSAVILLATSLNAMAQGTTYMQLLKKDWAQLKVYQGINSSLAISPDVVFMGDSITEIWFNSDSSFFRDNNFAARGISGQTSTEMLVRFRQDVLNLKPKTVVILCGTNDIAMNNGYISLENILQNIVSMCELALYNNVNVILCSVLPCAGYKWRPEVDPATLIPALNGMLQEYASQTENVAYLDYFSLMADENNGLIKEYTYDGCHPTAEGFKVMEKAFMNLWK